MIMSREKEVLARFYGCLGGGYDNSSAGQVQLKTVEGLLKAEAGFIRGDGDYIDGIVTNINDVKDIEVNGILTAAGIGLYFTRPQRAAEIAAGLAERLGKDIMTRYSYSLMASLISKIAQNRIMHLRSVLNNSLRMVVELYLKKGAEIAELQRFVNIVSYTVLDKKFAGMDLKLDGSEVQELLKVLKDLWNEDNIVASYVEENKVYYMLKNQMLGALKGEDYHMGLDEKLKRLAWEIYYKEAYSI